MITIALLLLSNLFMTLAWYGHLKYPHAPLAKVILISWSIALLEYCFQVPANRLGARHFSPYQLKALQEIITLVVFVGFALVYLGQTPRWNHLLGFGLILAAVLVMFYPGANPPQPLY